MSFCIQERDPYCFNIKERAPFIFKLVEVHIPKGLLLVDDQGNYVVDPQGNYIDVIIE